MSCLIRRRWHAFSTQSAAQSTRNCRALWPQLAGVWKRVGHASIGALVNLATIQHRPGAYVRSNKPMLMLSQRQSFWPSSRTLPYAVNIGGQPMFS